MSPRRLVLFSAFAIVAVFGLIQLIPSGITHPAARNEPPWDSPRTRQLAVAACFDCHSNQTRSFWYEKVAPVKWWIGNHVSEGRQSLNFSEWNAADNRWQPGRPHRAQRLDATELLHVVRSPR